MRFAALSLLLFAACGKSSASSGLPPATDWSTDDVTGGVQVEKPRGAPTNPGNDPHSGMLQEQEGDDEGDDGEGDPHAGVPGAPPMGNTEADPHAGVPGAPPINGSRTAPQSVSGLGLTAPDPNRPIDPTRRIKGVIKLDPKIGANLRSGAVIYLVVKRPGPDGAPAGSPLAVEKLEWTGPGQPFELTERQAMIAGTEFIGNVVVIARYDQDGDAGTKQKGDIVGMTQVKIPSDGVVISLDTLTN